MPTLDVEFSQVLVDFPEDQNGFVWHHRLLLVSLGGSRWICSTPTQSIQVLDLGDHRVIVLPRAGPFPAARAAETFAFDPADITPAVLADLMREARELSVLHGAQPDGPALSDQVWRICDTSHASFGEELPAAVLGNADLFLERDGEALVRIDGKWTHARREAPPVSGREAFIRAYHSGPGRDKRLMGDVRDPDGRRFMPLATIMPLLLEHVWPAWPISGPRSVREFLVAVRAAGHTALSEYHNEWIRTSGVSDKAAFAREHKFLLDLLRVFLQYDQVDASSLAGCELLLRRIYQIEMAVRRSPKAPDFEGLEFLMETAVDGTGAAVLPSIAKWVGETQHKEAFTLKQMRLWAEEKASLERRKKGDNKNKNGKEKSDE